MTYVFDTSSFIAWWNELYPTGTFPDIYELISHDIGIDLIKSPVEVKKELEMHTGDELAEWVKNKGSALLIKDDVKLQIRIAYISNNYPKLVKQARKHNADPIVIALAESNNWTVVTQENPNKKANIVGCCRDLNVKCISLSQYIRERQEKLDSIREELWS